jgi:acetyl esterase/lipase
MESFRRRDFIRGVSFLSVAAGVKPAAASYNPAAKFGVKVSEVEYRRTKAGRQLMARIYEPAGTGPFPTVLDLHGGAWNAKDRKAEEPMDRAIAESGVLVVAVDLTLAPESPYPACVQDANYAVRWLKTKAASWNGNPAKIGVYGSSSGGHVAELLAMRPRDSRYNAIPLREAPRAEASVAYVAMRSPISNTYARYQNAEKLKRSAMVTNNTRFFVPWERSTSNPRDPRPAETITKVPSCHAGCLTITSFRRYRRFGRPIERWRRYTVRVVRRLRAEWSAQPGQQTNRAREMEGLHRPSSERVVIAAVYLALLPSRSNSKLWWASRQTGR